MCMVVGCENRCLAHGRYLVTSTNVNTTGDHWASLLSINRMVQCHIQSTENGGRYDTTLFSEVYNPTVAVVF